MVFLIGCISSVLSRKRKKIVETRDRPTNIHMILLNLNSLLSERISMAKAMKRTLGSEATRNSFS
jgi:hypothetical protein